ncbi:MAG: bifunctional protein-serine/threonine kinase/phosphatase [Gammaproteobacteria bacterium]|jgi:serine/threonine protein kinase/serine/threonine protein phosphatase PrpC
MSNQLRVTVGQYSDKGRKPLNQDCHAVAIPEQPLLGNKGVAVCLADGISSSDVSQIASQAAVNGFISDYYCTSEAWSVKKSARSVLFALNAWLYAQTRQSQYRYDRDKGYVCACSALVIKSNTAHLFHVGDARIYRLRDNQLEQLTEDHRLRLSSEEKYLSRALGMNAQVEIDFLELAVEPGDVFLLATDGVHEHIGASFVIETMKSHSDDLEAAARKIAQTAFEFGSEDNLTLQLVRIESLPDVQVTEIARQVEALPLPPVLQARMEFDGYRILREVHASSRSHLYLAQDLQTSTQVIIKTPSIDLGGDPVYLERMLLEEWIARRLNNAHLLKAYLPPRRRHYLYIVTEVVTGQTLAQWMLDNPRPELETVRSIVEQIVRGLRALHRQEILHQDLRPNNIMIDQAGTVKIIDFGSASVAGLMEAAAPDVQYRILGTEQYTAPEYFLGEGGTSQSDLFSLGVITYQMLADRLPYGTQVSRARTRKAQRNLQYRSVIGEDSEIPLWVDEAIKKAVHPNPLHRYQTLSEFVYDLRQPNASYLRRTRSPLLERNPVLFWKGVSMLLLVMVVILLVGRIGM